MHHVIIRNFRYRISSCFILSDFVLYFLILCFIVLSYRILQYHICLVVSCLVICLNAGNALGGVLRPPGAVWRPLGVLLELSGGLLGWFWSCPEASWNACGSVWKLPGQLLEPSWGSKKEAKKLSYFWSYVGSRLELSGQGPQAIMYCNLQYRTPSLLVQGGEVR